MLDLPRYQRIRLSARPAFQRAIGWVMLAPNYNLPRRVRIEVENWERLPDEPVIFAMNHTDRYNYWPFQYKLWRTKNRFTATWVKGKYYENKAVGRFMEWTNNIPTVSRGYIITKDYMAVLGQAPSEVHYRLLRDWVEAAARGSAPSPELGELPAALLSQPRDVFGGRPFAPDSEDYATYINDVFRRMMARFVELNAEAVSKGLDLLIFPQGTRSVRLSRGHIGLAEIALKFGRSIVPVGCNGSDKVYPGGSPLARGGRIVYRLGNPIGPDEMAPFAIDEPFEPFTEPSETRHRAKFQGLTDLVMARINELLDPEYQRVGEALSDGEQGVNRFV